MRNKTLSNVLFIIIGILIIFILELKFVKLPELLVILLGFIGFALIINSAFEIISIFKNDETESNNLIYGKKSKKSFLGYKESNKLYDEDDLDKKINNLSNLAKELLEENRKLKEELKKYK